MLIRSQDDKTITKFDSISVVPDYKGLVNGRRDIDGYLVYASKSKWEYSLGKYSTEEKAIKVLDMICDFYYKSDEVFQMPQDEDVEV